MEEDEITGKIMKKSYHWLPKGDDTNWYPLELWKT